MKKHKPKNRRLKNNNQRGLPTRKEKAFRIYETSWKFRGRGICKALINKMLDSSKKVTYMLRGSTRNEEFYRSLVIHIVK